MSAEAVFATQGLKKSFGGLHAVNDVSLSVAAGEVRAIIGPNGAGKSTFFNMVCGELPPDGGQILFAGEDLTGLPAYTICRKGISRTMQITHIFPRMTVLDNAVIAVLARMKRTLNLVAGARRLARAKAEEYLQMVGLLGQADKVSGFLAHGDQKRLELAIALANQPQLLLLDEPTAGLARPDRIEMVNLVARVVRENGLTLIFTEHDIDVVFSISDSITVLHQGRVIAEGSPGEIRQNTAVQEVYLGGMHAQGGATPNA